MLECKTSQTKKCAFLGGPGIGKTTLIKQLDVDYSMAGYISSICPDFARTYVIRYGPPSSIFEQFLLYEGQKQAEDELSHCDIIFCDNATVLSYVYGLMLCDFQNPQQVYALMKLYEWAMKDLSGYELFYIPREFPLQPDGVIYQDEGGAAQVDQKIKNFLDIMNVPYTVVKGDMEARINTVKEKIGFVLKRECKFSPETAG